MGEQRQHIVVIPFLAQGHIIPSLALAQQINQRYPGRFTITFVSTPLNIRNIRSSLPPDSPILLRELPFNSTDHGLPPDTENTDSVTAATLLPLLQATAALRPHFDRLVAEDIPREDGRPPICIIADVLTTWTVHIASELGVFHAIFNPCGTFGGVVLTSLWRNLPHLHTKEDYFGVPGLPETYRLHRSQLTRPLKTANGTDPGSVFFRETMSLYRLSNVILCNTAEELEAAGTALLRKQRNKIVWAIGPVMPLETGSAGPRAGKNPDVPPEACIEWLDSHPARSVLYVSFGSENSISAAQMLQLATGLEASGRPFIWVIRPPFGFDVRGEFKAEWLPAGFEERAKKSGRGLLVRKWAPQLEILSNGSVGAFLCQCGWNSIIESLSKGVPLITWPLASEQFYNSKMLEEELGVGVELARGTEQTVDGAELERVVGLMLGGEKGEGIRRKAAAAAEAIRAATTEEGEKKGSSLSALDEFIRTILRRAAA